MALKWVEMLLDNVDWTQVQNKPATATRWPTFAEITAKPTTLAGFGITDAAPSSHVGATGAAHGVATTSVNGFMASADKTKLDGIAANANNYAHPSGDGNLHVPVTGTTANGKILMAGATAGSITWGMIANATTSANGLMASADKTKLDGIAANANNYAHPNGDGNLHVPANGTTNNEKFLKAGATAGSYSWAGLAISDISGLSSALDLKAPLASPGFTGNVSVGTHILLDSTNSKITAQRLEVMDHISINGIAAVTGSLPDPVTLQAGHIRIHNGKIMVVVDG